MSKFLSYIHILRGIAIIYVVGVHVRGGVLDWTSHPTLAYSFSSLLDSYEGNGTVMFIFIAGFLFQHLTQHQFEYKRYLGQKFKMIILPYIVISIPIILFRIYDDFSSPTLPEDFQLHSPVYQFFYHLFVGSHLAPFWFISAIIIFYLTSPIFRAFDNAWFFTYVFPVILVAGMFTFRSLHNANPLLSYVHYVPVYLLGMWASRNKDLLLSHDLLGFWILFIIYTTITVADITGVINLPEKISFEEIIYNGLLIFNVYIFRAIILCFMFLFLLYRLRYVRMPFLEILADYSFGIFFVHFILITITRKIISVMNVTVDFNIVTFLSYFMVVLLLSTTMVFLIKKITGRYSRNLIGS